LAVPLDADDGLDPLAVELAAGRAPAECLRDVRGRVVHDAGDLVVETAAEHAIDLGKLHRVGRVRCEVARASELAGLDAGDLVVEALDASFGLVEAVVCSDQFVIGLAAFLPGAGSAFQLADLHAPVGDLAGCFAAGRGERGEVGGAVPRRFVQDGLDSFAFGEELGGAPCRGRCRGDAVERECFVAAALEARGEDVERVVGLDRRGCGALGGVSLAVFVSEQPTNAIVNALPATASRLDFARRPASRRPEI